VEHAQFEKVSSRVRDGMDDLFDISKPHFAAWLKVHNIDEYWHFFSPKWPEGLGSSLYYAAFCGFYDLAEQLILKYPEQVNSVGGRILSPLAAALGKRHFPVANLLYRHSAVVDVYDSNKETPLLVASVSGQTDIVRWLLDHGADANTRSYNSWTPLHYAVCNTHFEAVRVLLEHNVDINAQDLSGETPLYDCLASSDSSQEEIVNMVRQLLEHGADTNIPNHYHTTALHLVSSSGWLEVARLLLSYGAKVDEKDGQSRTPFQVAASNGHHAMTELLLEKGAVPQL